MQISNEYELYHYSTSDQLVARLQLVATRVGVGLGHAANGDVHRYADGLTAGRQYVLGGFSGERPRAVVALLGQRDGGAGASGGEAAAHTQRFPQRGDGDADGRGRRGHLLDFDVLNEHRLPRHAQCHGVRAAVNERRRQQHRRQRPEQNFSVHHYNI